MRLPATPGQWARLAALTALAIAVWTLYVKATFVGWVSDPLVYLDPARHFARGLGMRTNVLYPAQAAGLPGPVRFPVPYLHHGPLAPLMIGAAYKLFGFGDLVPLYVGFACLLAAGLIVYGLGNDVGGERVGLTAAAFFWINVLQIESCLSAPTDPPFIAFVAASLACLWQSAKPGRGLAWTALAGVFLGLASCTRLAGQTYWVGMAIAAVWLRRRDLQAGAVFLAALAACLAPLAWYNHRAAGVLFYSPGFYMLNWSPSFPGFKAVVTFRSFTSLQALLLYPKDFLIKSITGPMYAARQFLEGSSGSPYAMACVVLGLFSDYGAGKPAQRMRNLIWLAGLPPLAFIAVISYGAVHYLDPVLAFAFVAGALFFWKFFDENKRWAGRWAAAGWPLFALLFFGGPALTIKDHYKSRAAARAQAEDHAAIGAFLQARTQPGEVVYMDEHRMGAWYGERPSVMLTATMEDARLMAERVPPDALLLTSINIHSEDFADEWRQAFRDKKPILGLAPCDEYRGASYSAVLYRKPGRCAKHG